MTQDVAKASIGDRDDEANGIGVPSSQTLGNIMRVAVHLLGYAFDELLGLLADTVAVIQGLRDSNEWIAGFESDVLEDNTQRPFLISIQGQVEDPERFGYSKIIAQSVSDVKKPRTI